jgi:hypothetical protein
VSRPKKDPLRPFTNSERRALEQLARSHGAPALSVARARALLAVRRWQFVHGCRSSGWACPG